MRTSPEKRWADEHSKQFTEHYKNMHGYIRREVTRANLQQELNGFLQFPKRVVDIGGGTGDDARWLAHTHHEVTLIDPTPEAIAEARSINHPALEDIIEGDVQTALDRYGEGGFDLALSHGVLLYLEQPMEELDRLARLVRCGGYLSLLTAGFYGKRQRFERRGQLAAALRVESTGRYVNDLGLEAFAYLPQEVSMMLEHSGFEVQNWFGVRVLNDDDVRSVDEVPAFHRNRLIDEELRASREPALKPAGQMLHFIARKIT